MKVGTTSGNYDYSYDVGYTTSFIFRDTVPGQEYFFAVGAYTQGPVFGPLSTEVSGFGDASPVLANPGNQSSTAGTPASLQLVGTDPGGSPLSYTATGLPPGVTLTSSTGFVFGTPTVAGTHTVTATVSDGSLSDSETFTWTVTLNNAPPVLTNPGGQATTVGTPVSLQLTGNDPNGTQVSFAASGLPNGLTINAGSGLVSGTPTTAGNYTVVATVSDGILSDSETFGWTTTLANAPPVLANPGDQTSMVGETATLQLLGSDPNGSAVTFSATGRPAGLSINTGTGKVSGTPASAGAHDVAATVSDGQLSSSETFRWTTMVSESDSAPPSIRITTPTTRSRYFTRNSYVVLGGTASDDTEVVEVSWSSDRGGSGVATGTDSWIANVGLTKGWNRITVSARDRAGNVTTDYIRVRRR